MHTEHVMACTAGATPSAAPAGDAVSSATPDVALGGAMREDACMERAMGWRASGPKACALSSTMSNAANRIAAVRASRVPHQVETRVTRQLITPNRKSPSSFRRTKSATHRIYCRPWARCLPLRVWVLSSPAQRHPSETTLGLGVARQLRSLAPRQEWPPRTRCGCGSKLGTAQVLRMPLADSRCTPSCCRQNRARR